MQLHEQCPVRILNHSRLVCEGRLESEEVKPSSNQQVFTRPSPEPVSKLRAATPPPHAIEMQQSIPLRRKSSPIRPSSCI